MTGLLPEWQQAADDLHEVQGEIEGWAQQFQAAAEITAEIYAAMQDGTATPEDVAEAWRTYDWLLQMSEQIAYKTRKIRPSNWPGHSRFFGAGGSIP